MSLSFVPVGPTTLHIDGELIGVRENTECWRDGINGERLANIYKTSENLKWCVRGESEETCPPKVFDAPQEAQDYVRGCFSR